MISKRLPGIYRSHRPNWGVVNEAGDWAFADEAPLCFGNRAQAEAWIANPEGVGKTAMNWRSVSEEDWRIRRK